MHLKTLRHRLLLLFAVLAVGPLLALGLLDYARARRAVERIVIEQTLASAQRASGLVADRVALVESDGLLLSENTETTTLFELLPLGDATRIDSARSAADTFVRTVWAGTGNAYHRAEVRDASARAILTISADSVVTTSRRERELPPFEFPIRHSRTGDTIGKVALYPAIATVVSPQFRELAFGQAGYMLIIDRTAGTVLFDSRRTASPRGYQTMLPDEMLATDPREPGVPLRYVEADSQRLASIAPVGGRPWVVLSSAAMAEFTTGLNDARLGDLLVVVAMAVTIAVAFTVFIGRTTRSLEELTLAARAVAQGDLEPRIPPPSGDEVGTLSGAFDHMLARLKANMREIEVSRQLAVLGEFSAGLSHEIRNPLTSIKLNLQALSRDVRRGRLAAEAGPALETCLREVNRLDGVVRGVLTLARPRSLTMNRCDVHGVLDRVARVHALQLESMGIVMVHDLKAARSNVSGDEEALVGLFTNLVINAIDAQPGGGKLFIGTSNDGTLVHVVIADDGPGVPAAIAARMFHPFVSGKDAGTGLGLALALSTARDHQGSIDVTEAPAGLGGAALRVSLPLA